MKPLLSLLSIIILINLSSCDNQPKKDTNNASSNFDYSGVIQDVIQTSNYTYCLVKDDTNEKWLAVSKIDVTNGQTLYFNQGLEMVNFHS